MSDVKPEIIKIDILKEECFLCFDTPDSHFIELKCCHRQNIHLDCLFQIFLNYLSLQNNTVLCPLCRQDISIKEYFTLDDLIESFSKLDEQSKKKFLPKFNNIITYNYIDSNCTLQIDETTSTTTITDKSLIKRYLFVFVLFVVLVSCVVGFKMIW